MAFCSNSVIYLQAYSKAKTTNSAWEVVQAIRNDPCVTGMPELAGALSQVEQCPCPLMNVVFTKCFEVFLDLYRELEEDFDKRIEMAPVAHQVEEILSVKISEPCQTNEWHRRAMGIVASLLQHTTPQSVI